MIAEIAVLLGVMLAAILVGVPVFLGMALAAAAFGLVFMGKLPAFVVGQTFVQGIDSYSFCAIPFFFLAGEIMNVGGISRRLLRLARALIGHVRGGLSHVNILACMVFSGVSGSAAADASAVGAVMIPAMKAEGYPAGYAAAVTAAASTMGPIIPPSIPLVIFGLIGGTSIGKLFVGGVVPGLLMAAFLLVASYVISRLRNYPAGEWLGLGELAAASGKAALALLMPVIVVGGLVSGVATTTEIGAVAVIYAVVISVVVYREASVAELWAAVRKAAIDSSAILVIAAVVGVFTWIIADIGVGRSLAAWIGGLTRDPTLVLAIVALVLLVAGTVLGAGHHAARPDPADDPGRDGGRHRPHPFRRRRRPRHPDRLGHAAGRLPHLSVRRPGRRAGRLGGARAHAVRRRPGAPARGAYRLSRPRPLVAAAAHRLSPCDVAVNH